MAFAISFSIEQADNGKVLVFTDTSTDTDSETISNVSLSITYKDVVYNLFTSYPGVDNSAPISNKWDFGNTKNIVLDGSTVKFEENLSGTSNVFEDGVIIVNYTIVSMTSVTSNITGEILLDYNSKYYVYNLAKSVPYKIEGSYAYNKSVEESCVASVLLEGMQYSAAVGQKQKALDILDMINDIRTR